MSLNWTAAMPAPKTVILGEADACYECANAVLMEPNVTSVARGDTSDENKLSYLPQADGSELC